mgnify:CR=1 FL=1
MHLFTTKIYFWYWGGFTPCAKGNTTLTPTQCIHPLVREFVVGRLDLHTLHSYNILHPLCPLSCSKILISLLIILQSIPKAMFHSTHSNSTCHHHGLVGLHLDQTPLCKFLGYYYVGGWDYCHISTPNPLPQSSLFKGNFPCWSNSCFGVTLLVVVKQQTLYSLGVLLPCL